MPAALGLREGELGAGLEPAGSLVAAVRAQRRRARRRRLIPKGGWPKLLPGGANVNALTRAVPSDMGASTTVHGLEVALEPV